MEAGNAFDQKVSLRNSRAPGAQGDVEGEEAAGARLRFTPIRFPRCPRHR